MLGLQLYLLLLPAWPDVGAVVVGGVVLLHAVAAVPLHLHGGPSGVVGVVLALPFLLAVPGPPVAVGGLHLFLASP